MATWAGESNPVRSGTSFRPERRHQAALANGQRERVHRQHCYHALGYRSHSCSLVGGGDMTCGGGDFDAIQDGREAGHANAEKDASECKDQQYLRKGEGLSHGAIIGESPPGQAPFLCVGGQQGASLKGRWSAEKGALVWAHF